MLRSVTLLRATSLAPLYPGLGLLSLTSCLLGLQMSNWIPREQEGWDQLRLGHGKNEGEIKKGLCAVSGSVSGRVDDG